MHFIKTTIIALSIAPLVAGTASAVDRKQPAPQRADGQLAVDTQGQARVMRDPATGGARLVLLGDATLDLGDHGLEAKARQFLARYGGVFKADGAGVDVVLRNSRTDDLGMSHLSFTQDYLGVPVFAGELRFHFDDRRELISVNGTIIPDLALDPSPSVSPIEAQGLARRVVAKDSGKPVLDLETSSPQLMVYRTGLARGVPGTNHLVWKIEVGDGAGVRELVFVDAHRGFVVDRIQGIHDLYRTVRHKTFSNRIWVEGDPLPFSDDTFTTQQNNEVNELITVSGETYDLFSNITGGEWLSFNGDDREMTNIYEATFDPPCSDSLNASWNGRNTNFCVGLAVDDVIAHEWTHAYTDYTHNLIYAWQPGALNESYSDIFGEIVDLTNGHGLDSPNTKRTERGCSTFFGTPFPYLRIDAPGSIAGIYEARGAVFNPDGPWSESGTVELVDDGTDTPSDACETLQGFTSGRIALIDRGNCTFAVKTANAEDAGAAGIIVANNEGDQLVYMGGSQPPSYDTPAIFVAQSTGEKLKSELGNGVEATLLLENPSDNSVRWLVAEDGDSGAFRDMWNPNCMNNPGRVSDSAYYCLADDGGGVHINSGVPNHAFALLVDGGTYNGVTVNAIGMTRAAHIYWRAMREYQVPTTDFADHADLLEVSCNDLIGAPLTDLVTGEPAGQVVRATDCRQVEAAMLATEMWLEPTQCAFSTILEPGSPPVAATNIVWSANFDSQEALDDWFLTSEGVYPEYDDTRTWRVATDLPGDREGGALFAVDSPYVGNCEANDDDQSGVLTAESPTINLPASATSVFVVFDHYVATESGWDGGNLKLSVNGGEFELVPASAFAFNPYNDSVILSTVDDEQNEVPNANPLAGEAAFTGVDEGSVESSWGQSQVDLSSLVAPGASIRLRFDFGNDGCGGVDGWYIDTLKVLAGGQPTASILRPTRRVSP